MVACNLYSMGAQLEDFRRIAATVPSDDDRARRPGDGGAARSRRRPPPLGRGARPELPSGRSGGGRRRRPLLHGWPQHWYEWRACCRGWRRPGYRAIAIDLRGFGWATRRAMATRRRTWRATCSRCSTRSASPGEAGRPRLGRLDRVPALPARAAALRALPGAEHPAPRGSTRGTCSRSCGASTTSW